MKTPPAAKNLGFAGLIPFISLAGLALYGDPERADAAQSGLILYGGVILSFMGGCRWGFSAAGLGDGPRFAPLALSVTPALLAWAVLWAFGGARPGWSALLLILGFAALYAWDAVSARRGETPSWWPRLRLPLSAGAILSLSALFF